MQIDFDIGRFKSAQVSSSPLKSGKKIRSEHDDILGIIVRNSESIDTYGVTQYCTINLSKFEVDLENYLKELNNK